ncbi:hypothetical protein BDP27DRAFT_1207537 [Rhodocollybia butyracea]|uniref:Uncharacterized protein n=1 Tax=Rhodocollybia butyracea TaxID=206335 RepID=A0A9P5Q9F7_9AGAR|nr:hypothetical protein BDP27DRAFT_1207537 [Rhodocollybia butyracea]
MLIPYLLNASATEVVNITEILSASTITSRDNFTPGTCSIRCRTTLQIFWSCASVLIACTWVSIHPNIPGPKDNGLRVLAEKIFLMLVTLIVPEMMLYWAYRDWSCARILANRLQEKKWTESHAFFALMGGFALYESENLDGATYNNNELDGRSLLAHADFIGQMTEREVKDRSHSDGFSKLIAVAQTTWLVLQLLARVVQELPATELEVMTAAFAFLNILLYFFWWNKPQGVGCPIRIQRTQKVAPQAEIDVSESSTWHMISQSPSASPDLDSAAIQEGDHVDDPTAHLLSAHQAPKQLTFSSSILNTIWQTVHAIWKFVCSYFLAPIPKDFVNEYESSSTIVKFFTVVVFLFHYPFLALFWLRNITGSGLDLTTIFGAIHCTAWGLTFPGAREQLLWRISSLIITGAPLATLSWILIMPVWAGAVWGLLSIFLYASARLILVVLPFIELKNLPSKALETVQWTALIPHI